MTTGAVCIGGVCAVVGSVCCILEGEGGSESVIGILCFSFPVGIGVGGIQVVDVEKVILLTSVEIGVDTFTDGNTDVGIVSVFSTLEMESVLETTIVPAPVSLTTAATDVSVVSKLESEFTLETTTESVIIFSDISLTAENRFDNKPNSKHSQGKVR